MIQADTGMPSAWLKAIEVRSLETIASVAPLDQRFTTPP